ncbi:MAG: RlmE family RNA methyltransferase [Phycisphaeraceae bacterium]|nr:RlmE family RNA methyltransferase [Phycisphaeraceae bacterium]
MARRVLHDRYFKQAKAEGYLARSAYKLKELQERFALIRPGDLVVDLGCAPGSWMQVAAELVGPQGAVVGIDLKEVRDRLAPNVAPLVGDINTEDAAERLLAAASDAGAPPRLFDVLLSDMAPNTSGAGDDLVSCRLCHRVLDLAPALLRAGGHLAMKALEGAEYPGLVERARSMFREARGFKPKSSREVSREMFVVARGFRPT